MLELLKTDLVKALDLESLTPDRREELLVQIEEVLENRIDRRLRSMLRLQEEETLDRLVRSGGDVEAFVRSRIPSLDDVLSTILADFKKDLDYWKRRMDAAGRTPREAPPGDDAD